MELETRAITVEKKMAQLNSGKLMFSLASHQPSLSGPSLFYHHHHHHHCYTITTVRPISPALPLSLLMLATPSI
jgi:hypothetical protein